MVVSVLSVAEKPSVAKELARIISGDRSATRQGHSQYNRIFEFQCQFQGAPAFMHMTSVTGHMMEIEFERTYKSWTSCNPIELFEAPIIKTVKAENDGIKRTLQEEARKCSVLLLWLDCDLEGENIGFEVIHVCNEANPHLRVFRARFSALIHRDIMRALQYPDQPNTHFNDAVEARQEIDLRLGAIFTRFQSLRLQSKYDELEQSIISYGPCQFPTLGFVVERHQQIEAFRPENFWSIECDYDAADAEERSGLLTCRFSWDRGHVYDHFSTTVLYELCLSSEPQGSAKVVSCESKPSRRYRPAPMNTIELQKRASRFLRMGSDRTMHIAEALYQRGILSYTRTETVFFKEGTELKALIEEHRIHSNWGNFASSLLDENKFEWPKAGGHDDQAHPPIHPTKCVELTDLTDADEKALYDLVVRHFLACCAGDGIGSLTTVKIRLPADGAHGEHFSSSGQMILERNWLEVYSKYEKWNANKIPTFRVGDIITLKSVTMTAGVTKAPSPLSEVDLISDMDKNGIGTDATIATHISTIQQRQYVLKDENNRFIPTPLGMALVEAYNSMGYQLTKPYLRASMEADCQKIARGELNKADVVRNCLLNMKECFIKCSSEANKLDEAMARHFNRVGVGHNNNNNAFVVTARNLSTCGVCHDGMDLRVKIAEGNPNGNKPSSRHLYCGTCNEVHVLPPRGELTQHESSCIICGFQVLNVLNNETNKQHTICPHCFKNPPNPPIAEAGVSDFRCFSCAHEQCPLSGRVPGADVDVAPCTEPGCGHTMRLRSSGGGNNSTNNKRPGASANVSKSFSLSCTRQECKRVWWFPKSVRSVLPMKYLQCASCSQRMTAALGIGAVSVFKCRLTLIVSLVPPGTPSQMDACVCCSSLWTDIDHTPLALPGRTGTSSPRAPGFLGSGRGTGFPGHHGPATGRHFPTAHATHVATAVSPPRSGVFLTAPTVPIYGASDYGAALTGHGLSRSNNVNTIGGRGQQERSAASGRGGAAAGTAGATGIPGGGSTVPTVAPDGSRRECRCRGQAAGYFITKKGANADRPYFGCINRFKEGDCGYFDWADGRGNGTGAAGSRGAGIGTRAMAPADMVCSLCKEKGHYARVCPNR